VDVPPNVGSYYDTIIGSGVFIGVCEEPDVFAFVRYTRVVLTSEFQANKE